MSKKGGGAAPAAPDYTKLAQQQSDASKAAANATTAASRVNTSTPYGNVNWSQGPDGTWNVSSTLAPEQAAILRSLQSNQLAAGNNLPTGPLDTSGLPAWQTNGASAAAPNTSIDMSGLPQLNQDYAAAAKQAQDANYQLQTQMLDPQYQQQETAERARLINSGIQPGSAAYDQAINDFNRSKQQDYNTARLSSINAGNTQALNLNQQANQAYNTLFGARLNAGQFGNQAANQTFQNTGQAAELANTVRTAGLNEAVTKQTLPYQQYLQLMGAGSSIEAPQPQTYETAGYQAPDLYNAGKDQYQAAIQALNYQNQQRAAKNWVAPVLSAAGNFFTGNWGQAGQDVGSLFGTNPNLRYGG